MTKERELLRRAWKECLWDLDFDSELREEIVDFLADEPEAEPVAWLASYPDNPDLGSWFCHTNFADYEGVKCEPLYLHAPKPAEPAARKPIDDDLIMTLTRDKGFDRFETWAFSDGVRFAEKHHGIGENDE